MKRVLIADQLHITKRNFASLIEYFAAAKYQSIVVDHPVELLTAFGHYAEHPDIMAHAQGFEDCSSDELFNLRAGGVRLFSLARLELMSRLAAEPAWMACNGYGSTERALFDHIYETDRDALFENLAAARFWCERWLQILLKTPPVTVALLFGGCLIYARAFAEVMQRRQGALYICESFFTGKDYYLEARHSPLPNQSLLKSAGRYSTLTVPASGPARRGLRVMMHKNLAERQNKNVLQQAGSQRRLFPADSKVVVILGQVLNDFSLLNTGPTGIHSLAFYRACIESLLEQTDVAIVFKAHPWERKKANVNEPKTHDALVAEYGWREERIKFVEDYPLDDLFLEADFAIGINTQSLLEAALAGIKPIQAGDAFYGRKGFTYDVTNVDEIANIVNSRRSAYLSLAEFADFESFMIKAFQQWFIPEDPVQGMERLVSMFGPVPIVTKNRNSKPATPKAEVSKVIQKSAPVALPAPPNGSNSVAMKKLQKLRRTPYAFFRDARSPLLKAVSKLF